MKKQNIEKVYATLPPIDKSLFRGIKIGFRPYRKGGIRVEKQKLGKQCIYHNYGHGGGGITLAPSTSQEIGELVKTTASHGSQVAVLGSGIVGLTSALSLAERGFKVKIYGKIIPNKNEKDTLKLCASQVAPGLWFPFFCNYPDQEEQNRRCLVSIQKYRKWLKEYKSVSECIFYREEPIEEFDKIIPLCTGIERKKVKVYFSKHSDKYRNMVQIKGLKVHLDTLLDELIQECKQKGVTFFQKDIKSLDDVKGMEQQHVVNCLGSGSRAIFPDDTAYSLKGHILQFQNKLGLKDWFFFNYNGRTVQFYCHEDKMVIGQTKETAEDWKVHEEIAERLYKDAVEFKKQYETPRSKL